jgi:hypothetical protein
MSANHMPPALGAILADHDHDHGPEYALVKCIGDDFTCSARERVEGSAHMTDEEITAVLAGRGWSVGPTLCPQHRSGSDQEGSTSQD